VVASPEKISLVWSLRGLKGESRVDSPVEFGAGFTSSDVEAKMAPDGGWD